MIKKLASLFYLACTFSLQAQVNPLLRDLERAQLWDRRLHETLPITYNHFLSTGYFTTPSARMDCCGVIGVGVAHVPPYLIWNGRIQPYHHLEFSLNYRIFQGVDGEKTGGRIRFPRRALLCQKN